MFFITIIAIIITIIIVIIIFNLIGIENRKSFLDFRILKYTLFFKNWELMPVHEHIFQNLSFQNHLGKRKVNF